MTFRRFASITAVTAGLIASVACGARSELYVSGSSGAQTQTDGGPLTDANDVDATVQCQDGTFKFQLALAQLMFVIDRSGSMKFTLNGVDKQPRSQWRWTILQSSLAQTITTFDNQIAMGAKFFPEELTTGQATDPNVACTVDNGIALPPSTGNAQNILSVFDSSTPLGGTPTSEAIRVAADALTSSRSVARTIVLATDGAPNCNTALDRFTCVCTAGATATQCAADNAGTAGRDNCLDDTRTIGTIKSTFETRGIPVFVIGIGSLDRPEFIDVLDDMAVAGGRPNTTGPRKHYSANSQGELTSALETVRDAVSKCTYLTPSAPSDAGAITVKIDGVTVPRDTTHANGWDWIDQRFGSLEFFGAACTRAQNASTPQGVGGTVVCEP